jgi:phosphoribosylglycinamide formyltransferase-1
VKQPDRPPLKLAVLISGGGRTLKNFLELIAEGRLPFEIPLVISSSGAAGGLAHAREAGIATAVFQRSKFDSPQAYGDAIFAACRDVGVDYVAMAGFMKLAPVPEDFSGRVLNIHPSLIPAFCGHGMFGRRVHEAVLDYGAKITGVSVHFVDNEYDAGPIIWQQPVPVFDDDTVDTLADRVFEAEKEAYPHVLRLLAAGRLKLEGRKVTIAASKRRSALVDD